MLKHLWLLLPIAMLVAIFGLLWWSMRRDLREPDPYEDGEE